jgi:hypothetical protein
MIRLPRTALVLLLIAILSTTAVLAAPGPGAQPRRSAISAFTPIDLVSQLWSFLSRVWSINGSEMVQTKNGSEVDPDGMNNKNGSEVDPNGNKLQILVPVTTNQGNGHRVNLSR